MAKNKLSIEFEGFDEVLKRLTELEGDVKQTTERALKASKKHVNKNLSAAMQKHNQTNETIKSLDKSNSDIEWNGTQATINIGFNIKHGGLPSIFLMYGTPRMDKDQTLYNAIYGTKTKKEITEIQEDIFYSELRKLGG